MNHVNARLLVLAAVSFAAPLPAQNPANDRVTLAGEFNGGHNFVVKTGSVYSFRYRNAPHAVEYRLDMADPAVQDGMIRIYEVYSDSYPIWEGGVAFRNASGALLLPSTLAPYVTLTSEALVGNTVVLEYTDSPPGGGIHRRRHTCTIKGQVFSITIEDLDSNTAYLNNYAGMFIGPTASTNSAQLLQMQGALSSPVIKFLNGTRTWFVGATIDLFQSNASDFLALRGSVWVAGRAHRRSGAPSRGAQRSRRQTYSVADVPQGAVLRGDSRHPCALAGDGG